MGRGYTPNDVDTKHDTNYEILRRMLGQLGAWVPTYLFPHLKGEFSKSARSIGRYLSCLSQILTVSNPRKHIVPRKQTRKSKAPMPIAYGSNADIAKSVCLRPSHAMLASVIAVGRKSSLKSYRKLLSDIFFENVNAPRSGNKSYEVPSMTEKCSI